MGQLIRFVFAVALAFVALPLLTFDLTYGYSFGAFASDVQAAADDRDHEDHAADSEPSEDSYRPAPKPGEPMLDPKPSVDPNAGHYRPGW